MSRKRMRKKKATFGYPTICTECGKMTEGGGACPACVRSIQRAAEEAANPRPPAPPPAPEPAPEPVALRAPGGCVSCGRKGEGLMCGGCSAARYGLPSRPGDPVIKYPRPCNPTTGW